MTNRKQSHLSKSQEAIILNGGQVGRVSVQERREEEEPWFERDASYWLLHLILVLQTTTMS